MITWDGALEKRRYALFGGIFGAYMVVVRGDFDLEHAPNWGGFITWVGNVRPAETRSIGGAL